MNIREFANHSPQLGNDVYIDPSAVVIGNVRLGDDCSVWPQAVIRGDMHSIDIGKRTSIQDGSVLHITHAGPYNESGWPLVIGDDVTVGHRVVLHGCTIGDRVLVGNGAIIMDGAIIDSDVVIGANTLVPPGKHLTSGSLYLGSPCKQARELSDKERTFFCYTATNYVKLKNQYLCEDELI